MRLVDKEVGGGKRFCEIGGTEFDGLRLVLRGTCFICVTGFTVTEEGSDIEIELFLEVF